MSSRRCECTRDSDRAALLDDVLPLVEEHASLVRVSDARAIARFGALSTEEERAEWRAHIERSRATDAWRVHSHVPAAHAISTCLLERGQEFGAPPFSQLAPSWQGTHVIVPNDVIDRCVARILQDRPSNCYLHDDSEWVFVDK